MTRLTDLRLILLTALVLRLLWIALVPMELRSDPGAYTLMARNLLEHGVYGFEPDVPHSTWPPGTSFFYAAIYALPLQDILSAKLANVAISVLNVWLTFLVGRALFNDLTGRIAAGFMAVWPQMIYFTTLTASEPLFIAAMLAGVYFWQRARLHWLSVDTLLCALFLAIACYFRSVALLLPVALLLSDVLRGALPLSRALMKTVLTMVIMGLLFTPWTVRNYLAFDKFILISSNFNSNLYIGNAGGSTGRFGTAEFPEGLETKGDPNRSEKLGEAAKREILENPGEFALRSLSKIRIIHDRETIGVEWNRGALEPMIGDRGMQGLKLVATLWWWAVLAAGLLAIPWHIARGMGWRILVSIPVAAWGYFTSVHAVILAADRFHMPQAAFVAMLAASMIAGVRQAQVRS